jgi:hypothetical protein
LGWWVCAFLLGVFGKTGRKTWCFGGEFVVLCMVNVVVEQPYLGSRKCDTSSGFILGDSCFGNGRLELRSIDSEVCMKLRMKEKET